MSIEALKIEYIIGFIFGVLGIALGIFLICFQFFTEGYIINSSSDPYSIFTGLATFGVVSLAAGAMAIHYTYQIFIPLKKNNLTYAKECPHCGAVIAENARICEKCKQLIANN